MAEAHSAVAFSFAITHEGWDVNFDREVLRLVWDSGIRSWKKRIARLKNNLKTGFFPVPVSSLFATAAAVSGCHFYGIDIPGLNKIIELMPKKEVKYEVLACAGLGAVGCLGFSLSLKYSLKLLFMYKGWMYESRGPGSKPSLKTRLWVYCVKILSGPSRPMLYSYQGSIPRLPLPSVKDTMTRYLRSVKPLLDEKQYARMEQLAKEFQNGIGRKLQRYLILKSWWSTNYVSDWWEEYVYLRGRSPLIINSNYYGVDTLFMHPTSCQAARAAVAIYSMLLFRRSIERQELEPIMLQGIVPLCSWQYERVFNTTRVPGVETDKIVHYIDSKHIVVYHRGRFFKVIIHHNRRLLLPCELEIQMQAILDDETQPCIGEEKIAALTAGDRPHWAHVRQEHFFKGVNRQGLDAIEKAAFFVCLDDIPYEFDKNDPSKLDRYAQTLLYGKGYDRWFDKSFTLCIGTNGKIGINAEHSWADAAVISHLWEFGVLEETYMNWYKEDGHTKGTPNFAPPPPIKLQWDLKITCLNAIEVSYQVARKLMDDIDLHIYLHDAFGKGFMKQCRLSPDAFLQMVLQLAYYRNAGKFSLTYEASMTRLFREGRTETVRPCSIESSEWVKSMSDNSKTVSEKVALLRRACLQHQRAYQDAMCGKGIDRHLFCLYVVSKYLEVDSPFLKEVLSEPWRLSTSQTPHGQTKRYNPKEYPNCISAGGGFGPVADDGYGVSYIIAGEDNLFFHISSKKSCPTTDSKKFGEDIRQALLDVRTLFLEYRKENGGKN